MLLGNRYGYQPFPSKIEASEFDTLQSIAEESQLAGYGLLCDWFLKDSNNIPAEYVLQVTI